MKVYKVLAFGMVIFGLWMFSGCDQSASGAAEGILADSANVSVPAAGTEVPKDDSMKAPAQRTAEVDGFEEAFQAFLVAWKSGKANQLDSWFHPELGMFVEYNPGAYTMAIHMKNARDFMANAYPYEHRKSVTCSPVPGKIPHFSCDEEKWDHEGCFLEKRVHTGLAKMVEQLGEWEIGKGKQEEFYPKAEKIDALETVCVFQTENTVGWNFAFIDQKWYLVRVDFVEPCSA